MTIVGARGVVVIEWTEALAIGIPEIDAQHCALVGLVNRLDALTRDGASRQELREVLAELVS